MANLVVATSTIMIVAMAVVAIAIGLSLAVLNGNDLYFYSQEWKLTNYGKQQQDGDQIITQTLNYTEQPEGLGTMRK